MLGQRRPARLEQLAACLGAGSLSPHSRVAHSHCSSRHTAWCQGRHAHTASSQGAAGVVARGAAGVGAPGAAGGLVLLGAGHRFLGLLPRLRRQRQAAVAMSCMRGHANQVTARCWAQLPWSFARPAGMQGRRQNVLCNALPCLREHDRQSAAGCWTLQPWSVARPAQAHGRRQWCGGGA